MGYQKYHQDPNGNNNTRSEPNNYNNNYNNTCILLSIHPKTGLVFPIPHDVYHNNLPNGFVPTAFLQYPKKSSSSDDDDDDEHNGDIVILVGTMIVNHENTSTKKKKKRKRRMVIYQGLIQRNYSCHEEEEHEIRNTNSGGGINDAAIPFVVHWTRAKVLLTKNNDVDCQVNTIVGKTQTSCNVDMEQNDTLTVSSFSSDCNVNMTYSSTTDTAVICMNRSSLSRQSLFCENENDDDKDNGSGNDCERVCSSANPILLKSCDGGSTWFNMTTLSITEKHKKEEEDVFVSKSRGLTNGIRNKPPVVSFMPPPPSLFGSSSSSKQRRGGEEGERLFAFGYEEESCHVAELKHTLRSRNIQWPILNVYEWKKK